jgi:hypothetical protein
MGTSVSDFPHDLIPRPSKRTTRPSIAFFSRILPNYMATAQNHSVRKSQDRFVRFWL